MQGLPELSARVMAVVLCAAAGLLLDGRTLNGAERTSAPAAAKLAPGNLIGHGGPVKAIAVSADGRLALTGSLDYSMMVWDLSGPRPHERSRFDDHDGWVNAVAFIPNSHRVLSGGDDGTLSMWDVATGRLVRTFKGHQSKIVSIAVSADGHWAATASWDRTARIWNLTASPDAAKATRDDAVIVSGHDGPVNAVAFGELADAGGGRSVPVLFTASYDGTVRAWQLRDGKPYRTIYRNGWGVNVLARVPGTETLVFGALDGSVLVLDAASGKIIKKLVSHDRPVLALTVLAKPGLVATGGGDGRIRVYRIGDWKLLREHQNPYGPVWALAFASHGARMFYGGLDDIAISWQVSPRLPFEKVASKFPRRFQLTKNMSLGERQFARKCSICHTLQANGKNRAGPTLYRLFGRRAGSVSGYPYSKALKGSEIIWTSETIGKLFSLGPEHYTPGTKMPLQRIADPKKRDALIAYLKQATRPEAAKTPKAGGGE